MRKTVVWCVLASLLVVSLLAVLTAAGAPEKGRQDDRVLSKVTFIHFRRGHGKPDWTPGGGGGKGGGKKAEEGHYAYISKGARWRDMEPFVLNPTNTQGLGEGFVVAAVSDALAEWESYAGDVFGPLDVDYDADYNDGELDDANTFSFGSYPDPWVIAVTTVWGYFSGPPGQREIVEADVMFNEDFAWGDGELDAGVMDLCNIATHEGGHCGGMGDVYEPAADQETMYGYSDYGETIKRDLYTGDITGITKLYQ